VNGYLERIAYAHDGSHDFRAVTSSLGHDDRDLGYKFHWYGRLKYQPARQPSTWYWTDGTLAVVIRRIPGNQGEGRDDRAHALFGTADELDLTQALALAGSCPLWTDPSWYGDGAGVLSKVSTSQLPTRRPLWESPGMDADVVNELWPIVHALRQRPTRPVWVFDTLSEDRAVSHIRAVAGIMATLGSNELPWTFATREDNGNQGKLVPRIRFVPGWGLPDVASDSTRTVIRSDYRDASADEELECRRLVTAYLTGGPTTLEQELVPAQAPPPPIPVATNAVPAQVTAPPDYWPPDQPTPPPPAPENAQSLFRDLGNARDHELSGLVRRLTQATVSDYDRGTIRTQLADPYGAVRRRLDDVDPAVRNQLLAQLLAVTAMRPDDWRSREAGRSVDRLLEVIGGPTRPVRGQRRRKQRRSWAELMPLAVWLMGAAVLVMALVVATTVTG